MSDVPANAVQALIDSPAPQRESRLRVIWRNAFPFIVVGLIWEAVARAGTFPPKLFPTIETIAAAFWRLTMNGILLHHAADTIWRPVSYTHLTLPTNREV